MALPPALSPAQRAAALEKASQSRKRRAQIKAKVKSGNFSIDEVLELASSDEAIAKMRVH